MQEQTIISKGKYSYPQTADIVSLKHYFFVRDEKGQKRLLLRFFNERKEVCTKFAFVIRFLDSRGKVIDEERFEAANIKIKGRKSHTFEEAIFVNERCTTFKVEVLHASYDSYKYTNEGDGIAVEYEKPEMVAAASKHAPKHIKAPRKIKVRTFKLSWMYMSFALFLLTVAIVIISFQLTIFKAIEDEFSLDGVEYEFVDKTAGTVRITGCTGTYKNVIIPSEIEGYKVVEVADRAFEGDRNLQKIRIEGVDVGDRTFANCPNLTEVEIKSITEIGENAFYNCPKLKKINISYPEYDERGEEIEQPTLQIGTRAFAYCTSLNEISIDQFANYKQSSKIFENDYEIKNIYLKNFAYVNDSIKNSKGEKVTSQETSLANMFESGYSYNTVVPKVETIKIEYIDNIYANFCQDFSCLKSFEVVESPVSTIGKSAFDGCVELEKLSFKFSIRIVEDRAFANCKKITSFKASEVSSIGKEAFLGCSSLSDFSLVNNHTIKSIGDRAFKGCKSITSIALPATLNELGKGALQGTSIKTFKSANSNLELKQGVLHGCYQITELELAVMPELGIGYLFISPDVNYTYYTPIERVELYTDELSNVKNFIKFSLYDGTVLPTVTAAAFAGCENIQAIRLEGVTKIEEYAFANCKKLVDLNIGSSVEQIGAYAFQSTGITAFTLPEMVTVVPEGIFSDCQSIASITLHENVEEIGRKAFYNCKNITSIDLYNTKIINEYAFENTGLTSIVVPKTAEYIGSSILKGCKGIKEITVPFIDNENQTISDIDYYFVSSYYDSLAALERIEKITINGGYAINNGAFSSANNVEEIVIEDGITYVDGFAFAPLTELRRLTLPQTMIEFSASGMSEAYRLYEICNHSQYNLDSNEFPNTLYISNADDDVAPRTQIDGYEFALYGDSWYLVNWDNDKKDVVPPATFTYTTTDTIEVIEWKVPPSLFRGTSLDTITLPSTVSEIGANAFYYCKAGTINLDENMVLAEISDGMFANCTNLKSITLPSTITKIGNNSFRECVSLGSISIPSQVVSIGDGAFYNCMQLKNAYFPSSLDYIGESAFYSCQSLGSVTLTYVNTIGAQAFEECTRMTDLVIYEVNSIEYWAFRRCIKLENVYLESVSTIGEKAFENCTSLQTISLPYSLTSLGSGAFYNCSSLESIDIPPTIDTIKSNTFENCYSLKEIVLPPTIRTIEYWAFKGCSALECVTLGEGLESMSSDAFYDSNSIFDIYNFSSLNIKEGSTDYSNFARKAFVHNSKDEARSKETTVSGFGKIRYCGSEWVVINLDPSVTAIDTNNVSYDNSVPTEIRFLSTTTDSVNGSTIMLKSIVFGDNVTQIHTNAFSYLKNLRTVDFSQNTKVTVIESSAFANCPKLYELTLPQNLKTIGSMAFQYCTKLLSVTLPASLETINYDAFYQCKQLLEVYDLTPNIDVEDDCMEYSSANGCVGAYAKKIYKSSSQGLERIEDLDGFYFVKYGKTYYLHHYVGPAKAQLVIPEISGYSIEILADAFEGSGATSVIISTSVSVIDVDTQNHAVMEKSYYKGTRDQWNASVDLDGNYYIYPKYYTVCIHDNNSWTYVNGQVSTDSCKESLVWSVTKEATCYDTGLKTGKCPCKDCTYYETNILSILPHSFVDGVCKYCQREYKTITPDNISKYSELFEITIEGFSMDENGVISSTEAGSISVTLVAKEEIEISYKASVLGGGDNMLAYKSEYWSLVSQVIRPGNTHEETLTIKSGDYIQFQYSNYSVDEVFAVIEYIKILTK